MSVTFFLGLQMLYLFSEGQGRLRYQNLDVPNLLGEISRDVRGYAVGETVEHRGTIGTLQKQPKISNEREYEVRQVYRSGM